MKFAIPTRGGLVDSHFGHCEAYTLFTVSSNNLIETTEMLPSPHGCGCKSNIAHVLQQRGVSVMLAGNMGNGALNVLNNHGIKVYRGCSGDVWSLARTFLQGEIDDSGAGCDHPKQHGEEHQCNH
jgi:predicted Fe-Mo cluster-binding NifX family protein